MPDNLEQPGNVVKVDLFNKKVPYKILSIISKEASETYEMVVLDKTEKVLTVGMVDPENVDALNALRFIANKLGLEVEISQINQEDFENIFKGYLQPEIMIDKAVGDYLKKEKEEEVKISKKVDKEKLDDVLGSAPVTKVVDVILEHAILGGASDIHIEPQEDDLRVRYRLDGDLYESFRISKEIAPAVISRVKILSDLKIDEKRKPQDGRINFKTQGREVDLRVSTMPTAEGEKVVMRILEKEEGLDKFENLGLFGRNLKVIEKGLDEPYGIILVTGPTGSGKSTTIFTCLRKINKIDTNIVTLEDPIEYRVPGVNHSQVKPEIGYTFASGLRSILRQDPDIIMVGEIRDGETAELATHAALTGHLVLSTLHTNDALGAIPRLVDMGIERFLLSSSLRVSVAQRLVRRLCENCKKQVEPSERIKEYVLENLNRIPEEEKKVRIADFDENNIKVWIGEGCDKCKNQGTKGRIAIYEVVECTVELRKIIDDDLNINSLVKEFRKQGGTFMREDGILKALNGFISVESVEEATSEDDAGEVESPEGNRKQADSVAKNNAEKNIIK